MNRDLSPSDFAGLIAAHEQRIEDRRHSEQDEEHPCTAKEELSMLGGAALFVLLVIVVFNHKPILSALWHLFN